MDRNFSLRQLRAGVLVGIVVLVTVALLFLVVSRRSESGGTQHSDVAGQSAEQKHFVDEKTGFQFSYDARLQTESLTDLDVKDGFLARISGDAINEELLVSVRAESGFKLLSNTTKHDPIDIALGTIERAYPDRYPGYAEISRNAYDKQGRDFAEIIFTYDGPAKAKIKQRLLVAFKDQDQATYVSAQALESEFERLNDRYIKQIIESATF